MPGNGRQRHCDGVVYTLLLVSSLVVSGMKRNCMDDDRSSLSVAVIGRISAGRKRIHAVPVQPDSTRTERC